MSKGTVSRSSRRPDVAKAHRGRRDSQRNLPRVPEGYGPHRQVVSVSGRPAYMALVRRLVLAAMQWKANHPRAELSWTHEKERCLCEGELRDDAVKRYLATSPDALALLRFMDEATGGQASLMQAQFALTNLGVLA